LDGIPEELAASASKVVDVVNNGCPYLTHRSRFHYQCLYYPDYCGKKANLNIMCPLLKVELALGRQFDHDRMIKRIKEMSPEYLRFYYLSLPQEGERAHVLDIIAEIRGIPLPSIWSREKLSRIIRNGI
jgi:hypothetical protein